jgi:Family of unknown function (DUF6496)
MGRYSKSASDDVKGAMKRRKAGTLKSGGSGKDREKQEAGDCDRTLGGAREGQEGSQQEIRVRRS